jgi:hypothetical protein
MLVRLFGLDVFLYGCVEGIMGCNLCMWIKDMYLVWLFIGGVYFMEG